MVNHFDYIIVGSGSAGGALAARLSEDPATSVCVLEAGGSDRHLNVRIPAGFPKLFHTERDWDYYTEPEEHSYGNRQYIPRGKMLGGSASMNAMSFVRGNRYDYDSWADKHGAKGWSYEEVLPYYKAMETFEGGADAYRGGDGPLPVRHPVSLTPLSKRFLHAAEELGYPFTSDLNGASQWGATTLQSNIAGGRRFSGRDAWLVPAMKRPNLTVKTKAHVHRVVTERGRAIGVDVEIDGEIERITCEREVVLSAGAIGTPQLLMLSGIGPAAHLKSLGISPVVDNANVGEHLQDHPTIVMHYETSAKGTLAEAEHPRELLKWLLLQKGLLTSTVAEAYIFYASRPDLPAPDVQMYFAPVFFFRHGAVTHPHPAYAVGPNLVAPASRGHVRIRSTDPHVHPRIVGNYLGEPQDVEAMLDGMDRARDLAHTSAMKEFTGAEIHPGPDVTTREGMKEFMLRNFFNMYHPTSTARMGVPGEGVVDHELKVYGVDGLRVADASVFPTIIRGNTNAPSYLVGWKAADLIRHG
jgi:choline dehydrogenase